MPPYTTKNIILLAAKCGDPLDHLSLDDSESILVQAYSNLGPIPEGAKINFTCITGMELVGPNSTTCMGNGEWEPNPRDVTCKSKSSSVVICYLYHHVLNQSTVVPLHLLMVVISFLMPAHWKG